ncbi:hypothetical protein OS493_037010 [Desmophyllum pertusum]|uniref:Uncharacterized protein n=1 Tax=Desmophyllum pertusum TaxID=174260 RepID=A0A9W9YL39_9CNID|nr:hypothetical protein OS493_037010 [Desmophyllum pertusum]
MSFYVTLPSDASSMTFPNSKRSNYKVRLPNRLFLHEDDWEVALSAISFPDSQAYIPHNAFGEFPMTMSVATKPVSGGRVHPEIRKMYWVRSSELEKAQVPIKDGISFVKKIIQELLTMFHEELKEGAKWGDADHHQGIPEFTWMQRGKQIDLHIDNTKTHTFSQHTYLDFDINLAQAFGMIKNHRPVNGKGENPYRCGILIYPPYPNHPITVS